MRIINRWKRRYAHAGVYLYRTRKHMRPGTEWGYAGKSRNLVLRDVCHRGGCTRHAGCRGGKPWADLIVRRHTIELPWWLGFDWITLSIETALIWVFRPRYNWQKNPRKDKVYADLAARQRHIRDHGALYQERMQRAGLFWLTTRVAAVAMIVIGAGGWWLTR